MVCLKCSAQNTNYKKIKVLQWFDCHMRKDEEEEDRKRVQLFWFTNDLSVTQPFP